MRAPKVTPLRDKSLPDPDLKKMHKGLNSVRKYFEDSMVAITFAEAGEHGTAVKLMSEASDNVKRILPKNQEENIDYQLKMTGGNNEQEIIDYVNQHRDIVLAIYNPDLIFRNKLALKVEDTESRHRKISKKMQRKLSVPLVVIGH